MRLWKFIIQPRAPVVIEGHTLRGLLVVVLASSYEEALTLAEQAGEEIGTTYPSWVRHVVPTVLSLETAREVCYLDLSRGERR